jgi:exo-1,4-beta-D-glucosaminidase
VRFTKEVSVDAAADGTAKVFELPRIEGLTPAYFLDLRVFDAAGALVGSNFYWLSTTARDARLAEIDMVDDADEELCEFHVAGAAAEGEVDIWLPGPGAGEQTTTRVVVENPSSSVAFFVRLKLTKGNGDEVLPVLWQDNYISLLPGEKREISATFRTTDLGPAPARVEVQGWNVDSEIGQSLD